MKALTDHFKTQPSFQELFRFLRNDARSSGSAMHVLEIYDNFLKKPLELSMLVPYDGEVLEKPKIDCYTCYDTGYIDGIEHICLECNIEGTRRVVSKYSKFEAYQQALSNVIYDFKYKDVFTSKESIEKNWLVEYNNLRHVSTIN